MTVKELYKIHYEEYRDFTGPERNKYNWAADEIFELTTYDGGLDELFVKKIIEVLDSILDGYTFEYIRNNYITYILVCQLLCKFGWIDWGSSIRGAWLDDYSSNARPILNGNLEGHGCTEIKFTKENLKELILFIEETDEK